MAMFNTKGNGLTKINLHRWKFMEENICCMVRSPLYFEFFNCNQILIADLYSQQLQSVHETLLRKCPTLINRRNIVLLSDYTKTFSKNHARKNIGFRLVCSTPSTIFPRPCTKQFPSFSFSIKCTE